MLSGEVAASTGSARKGKRRARNEKSRPMCILTSIDATVVGGTGGLYQESFNRKLL